MLSRTATSHPYRHNQVFCSSFTSDSANELFRSSRSAPFADNKTFRQNLRRASRVEARSPPASSRTLNAEEAIDGIAGELQKEYFFCSLGFVFTCRARDVHHSSCWSVVSSLPKIVPLAWDRRPKISLTHGRFTLLLSSFSIMRIC